MRPVCVSGLRDGYPVHRWWYHRLRAHEEHSLSDRRCWVSVYVLSRRDRALREAVVVSACSTCTARIASARVPRTASRSLSVSLVLRSPLYLWRALPTTFAHPPQARRLSFCSPRFLVLPKAPYLLSSARPLLHRRCTMARPSWLCDPEFVKQQAVVL